MLSLSAGHLIIEPLDDRARWNEFVRAAPDSTFCHLAEWRAIMEDVLGHEWIARAVLNAEGGIVGVLPLVRMKSRIFGHQLVSLPFLNYGGPIGTDNAQVALLSWATDEARQSRADVLELRARHELPHTDHVRPTHHKLTVVLDLPQQEDQLWSRFSSKLRSQIRRPQKEGMQFRSGVDQVLPFYDVFRRNMRDLGTPVLPRAFFEQLARSFADRVQFGVVYMSDVPVAAGCGFLWHHEFEMTWASSRREYKRMAPNMMLYWEFMRAIMARSGRAFNFGRCSPESSTHKFKLQWSGHDVPLGWARWQRGREAPSADGRMFALASNAWRRLPLPVANYLGPIIARRLAAF